MGFCYSEITAANPRKDVAYLVGSEYPLATIRRLADTSGRPTELADRCGYARETGRCAVGGFAERGWGEKRNDRYRLTSAGRIVLEAYETLSTTITATSQTEEFLSRVGTDGGELPPDVIADLEMTTATANNPPAPRDRYLSIIGDRGIDSMRGMTPIVSSAFDLSLLFDTAIARNYRGADECPHV